MLASRHAPRTVTQGARRISLAGFALVLLATLWVCGARAASFGVELTGPPEITALLEKNLQIHAEIADASLTALRFDFLVRRTADEIADLLMTEGYFSAVVERRVDKLEDRTIAHFAVRPGPRSRISRVDLGFSGAVAAPGAESERRRQELQRAFPLRVDAPFRVADWEKAKDSLLQELRSKQYPAATIAESQALVDPEAHAVAVSLVLDSGPAFTFGELAIEGLATLPSSIITGLYRIEPGSPYSEQALIDLQKRLQQTNYFRSVFVTTPKDPAHPERVPVRVSVVENTAREIGIGAGYNTDTGAGIELRYDDNLTFQPGWRSRSTLKLEQREQSAGSQLYLLPILGGLQPRLDAKIKQTQIQNEDTQSAVLAARLLRPGFDTEWSLSLELRRERKETDRQLLSEATSLPLTFSWTRRVLDDMFYPRKGFVANLQGGGGFVGGASVSEEHFTRVYGKVNGYWPVGERGTLLLRGEVGAVHGASRQNIPDEYLFRAGGSQSVRGYSYGELGISQNGAIVPGRYLAVASVELSHPVTEEWSAAVFYDAGNVVDQWRSFTAAKGYGIGARWRSPLGPLNLDLAYGETFKQFRVHLSVGVTF